MPSPSLKERYAKRTEELQALTVTSRPEDPGPVVAQVLGAAGDLLRRRAALQPDLAALDRALEALPDTALDRWRQGLELGTLAGRLEGAVGYAVEAAVPDDDGDAGSLATWAMQGLQARDQLQSALVALERLAGRRREAAGRLAAALSAELERVDRRCRAGVAGLTPLNPLRRPEAALLDLPERDRAWWFSARAGVEDDQLVPVLAGERRGTLGPADRRAGEVVSESRRRPVSSRTLLRMDLGLCSEAEVRAVRRQAEGDPELALALAAMEAGEAAIEALERGPEGPQGTAPVRPTPPEPEALHLHPEFKVLVLREARVLRLVVAPRAPGRLAAAALFRPGAGEGPGLQGTPAAEGLEFEVPREPHGKVRLKVTLADGRSEDLELPLE